ncbi:MAG: ABC transporter [Propionibacterium sp.]|nr:ABC transporter [Propionibacterium sp.]
MRKLLSVAAASLAATLALAGCADGATTAEETPTPDPTDAAPTDDAVELTEVVVGASPVPHATILEFIRDNLAEDAGISIEIREFDDYVLPNQALNDGELDANYFQHIPYFESEVAEKGYEFEHGEGVHIEPLRVFSNTVSDPSEVEDGATVAITNDVSNQARGLLLLQDAGLLDGITLESSVLELTEENNPKGLNFEETQPEIVVQLIEDPQVDLAVINANFILTAGLNPDDAVFAEEVAGNPYANIVAWRTDNDNEGVAILEELLHSAEVAEFIETTWPSGDVIPG